MIKKWLSYREKGLLGRSLSVDEARYVTETARRITALTLLGPQLDENYRAVTQTTERLDVRCDKLRLFHATIVKLGQQAQREAYAAAHTTSSRARWGPLQRGGLCRRN